MRKLKIKLPVYKKKGRYIDDPAYRVYWEFRQRGRLKNFPKENAISDSIRADYKVKYAVEIVTDPSVRKQPQFSIITERDNRLELGFIPISCQEYLRTFVYEKMLVVNSTKTDNINFRLFFELSPATARPSLRMKRALKMAQELTSFVEEDASKVKLYKAVLPELAPIEKSLQFFFSKKGPLNTKESKPELAAFSLATKHTGFISTNQNRLFVLEAPSVWLSSPFMLSIFGRLVRDALFKRPLRLEDYKTKPAFVKALHEWEGKLVTYMSWRKSFAVAEQQAIDARRRSLTSYKAIADNWIRRKNKNPYNVAANAGIDYVHAE